MGSFLELQARGIINIPSINADLFVLTKEAKRLDKKIESKSSGGGGTSAWGVRHALKSITHTEAPSGLINGSNTEYTVLNEIFFIFGFTLNGEQIAELPNFTYAGKKITFSSAIPASFNGKDFECKYLG